MDKAKLVTHTSSLNTNMQYYLNKFDKNQQWADIAPLLQKMEGLLKQHPSPYIQEKIQLSKRLGQCLNPQLSAPIHQSVLKIYDQLFRNMGNFSDDEGDKQLQTRLIMEDLALYSIGLFPFFQNASSKVRPQYLDLILSHYVPLGRELIPMIPGLVASILPGLDDQQELIQKKCMQTLDSLHQSVGRRYLMGAIWMAMLRSPKCRSSSLKYLSQNIQKMIADEDEDQENYYSSENEDYEVKQKVEPEILEIEKQKETITEMQIDDDKIVDTNELKNVQNEIQKQTIHIESGNLFQKKQELIKLELGINDDEPINNYPSIYVNSLINCLEDENQLIKRQVLDFMFTHLKSHQIQENKGQLVLAVVKLLIRKDLSVTRRVNQWLFGKPDMDNKYQITELNKPILIQIADAFNQLFDDIPNEQNATFPLKLLQNFFMEHDHMVEMLIDQISYKMIFYVEKYHKLYPETLKSCKRLLESITSYLLITINSITKELNPLIEFVFTNLLTKEDNIDNSVEFSLLRLAASNISNCVADLQIEDLKMYKPAKCLQLILERMEQLPNKLENNLIKPHSSDYDQAFLKLGNFYQGIADNILQEQQDDELLNQFECISKVLVKGQKFKLNKEVQQLPGWFTAITKIIREDNPSIALIAIESMIEILVSEKVDPVYENLRKLIIDESKSKLLKNQLVEGQDYTKLTLEKLWNLLDYPYFHDRVILMIVNLSKVFPTFFTEVVIFQFKNMQEPAIRRFAVFWKLSAIYFKELQDLNKVGLFLMLDFLDHENPIIRHNAKNWLLESTETLQRILDPLFEVLIQSSSSWYITEKQQVFFAKVYETKRINETLKKLKSILLSFSSRFMEYVQETEVSQYIKDIRMHFTNENSVIMEQDNMMYLDLMVIICLKYVQGQAIESMSLKFYRENAAVNASACEYIELLISNVENPQISLKFAEYIMEPLQVVLYHAIENEDLVMQVQILNLFKVIFFNSSFRTKHTSEQKEMIEDTMSKTVSNSIFIPTLIRGMHTIVLYVRAQYIQFISTCIPLLAEHLRQVTLSDCVQQILTAYFTMIQQIANRQESNSTQQMNQFDYLQGSSQHEIQTILIGVKTILKHILGLQESEDIRYERYQQQQSMFGVVKNVITFGLLNVNEQSKIQKLTFLKFQKTCEMIINTLPSILELYINCWELSAQFSKYSDNLTAMGIGSYSFEKFNLYNKYLQEQKEQKEIIKDHNIVKPQIQLMMKPLFMHYSRDFMSSILTVWTQQCTGLIKLFMDSEQTILIDPQSLIQNTFLQKTIELLVMIQCPMELFLDSLLESQQLQDLQKYYDIYRRKKLTTTILNFQIAQQETSILFFIYSYFNYSYIDPTQLKRDSLLQFWNTVMKLLLVFGQSKAPSTILWLVEIQLLLTRKYSPKEIVNDQRFRNCHHEFINEKLKYLAQFGAKQFGVFWNDPSIKVDENQDPAQIFLDRFKIVMPLSPTLYDSYALVIAVLKKEKSYDVTEIEKIMFGQLATIIEDDIHSKYRLMCLRTLRNVSLELLQNSYAVEKTDRIVLRCKEFMDYLLPQLENRSLSNQIYIQAISELIYNQLEKARQFLLKAYRQPILDLFNREDFFNQNQNTLKFWAKIINWVVMSDKNDLFTEYLEQVTLQSSFFGKESEENKKRIKSFERICFVIYAGERDKYTKKLAMLIEKISEVIKTDSVHPGLEIMILFCVRILILRLSPLQLNELFRNMWPTLLTLLIQIFKNKQSSPNLILAALKLVEMISLMRQDEFYLHQWIFIYDYFGIKLQESEGQGSISPFQYQPQCYNFMSQKNYKVDYGIALQETTAVQQREIIIQQIKVDAVQLEEIAQKLCNYLLKLNSIRTITNTQDIEELIERDFIQLDEFIYEKS